MSTFAELKSRHPLATVSGFLFVLAYDRLDRAAMRRRRDIPDAMAALWYLMDQMEGKGA